MDSIVGFATKVGPRPIEVGDLLTPSPTSGYAMKASEASRPSVQIGKALRRLINWTRANSGACRVGVTLF